MGAQLPGHRRLPTTRGEGRRLVAAPSIADGFILDAAMRGLPTVEAWDCIHPRQYDEMRGMSKRRRLLDMTFSPFPVRLQAFRGNGRPAQPIPSGQTSKASSLVVPDLDSPRRLTAQLSPAPAAQEHSSLTAAAWKPPLGRALRVLQARAAALERA